MAVPRRLSRADGDRKEARKVITHWSKNVVTVTALQSLTAASLWFVWWQPQMRQATGNGHGDCFCVSETITASERATALFLPWYNFRITLPLYIYICNAMYVLCSFTESTYHLLSGWNNVTLCMHHCCAFVYFLGGFHVSGQIWPQWRFPSVPVIHYVLRVYRYLCIYWINVNLTWYLYIFFF